MPVETLVDRPGLHTNCRVREQNVLTFVMEFWVEIHRQSCWVEIYFISCCSGSVEDSRNLIAPQKLAHSGNRTTKVSALWSSSIPLSRVWSRMKTNYVTLFALVSSPMTTKFRACESSTAVCTLPSRRGAQVYECNLLSHSIVSLIIAVHRLRLASSSPSW